MVYSFDDYQYEWGTFNYPVSANDFGAYCRKLEEKEGVVTRQNLLDSARSEDSLIHNLYEWDNSIAGEKYRLMQSGRMLSSLKVKITMDDNTQDNPDLKITRAFLNTQPDNSRGTYTNVITAVSQPDLREGVLARAKKEMAVFVDKYRTLNELSEVIAVMETLLEDVS